MKLIDLMTDIGPSTYKDRWIIDFVPSFEHFFQEFVKGLHYRSKSNIVPENIDVKHITETSRSHFILGQVQSG